MEHYEKARIAIDAVLFTIHQSKLKIFLTMREKEPFRGKRELPGGLLQKNETAEKTLARKIKELLGEQEIFFQQFFTFTEPARDPRERTISIGFIALLSNQKIQDFSQWHNYLALSDLAFDHKKIADKARIYLADEINSLIVKQFMPDFFSLNDLQEAYEIIEDRKYDNRNFRKKIINSNILTPTAKMQKEVSHRPAQLYKFKKL